MKIPLFLYYNKKQVARLTEFSYETPWATAKAEFSDLILGVKLEKVTTFLFYTYELEDKDLTDNEEDILWDKKRVDLGLESSDLDLNKDGLWSIEWDDGKIKEARSISFSNGCIDWRP